MVAEIYVCPRISRPPSGVFSNFKRIYLGSLAKQHLRERHTAGEKLTYMYSILAISFYSIEINC